MTLENLLNSGNLKKHPVDKAEIQQLLEAALRNLTDAKVTEISLENRFDAAYKTIMQSALVALMANGYRPDARGHHQLMIQTLPKSIGLSNNRMIVLDALRRKRNISDYSGAPVDEKSTEACISEAQNLLSDINNWLYEHRPELA